MKVAEAYTYYTLGEGERVKVISKIREVLAKEGVSLAVVFGSFVELDSFRDIDIAIYVRGGANIDKVIELANELEEVLGVPMDIVPIDEVEPNFRLNILRRGVVVLEEPGVYEALLMQTIDELTLLTMG